ncbi:hypothetical protein FHG87_001643 [Trinorchestia longiramus]|nr:hypothetical protein FHG87_001643 [Trinorchestia longiramus]
MAFLHASVFLCSFFTYVATARGSLSIWRISVPPHVVVGGEASLECDWLSEGQQINGPGLYSLKWYHSLHEFYRWTPAKLNPMQVFPIPESVFTVDRHRSSRGRVVVKSVQLGAGEAPLRCEISGEAPYFHTDEQWAKMAVVVVPTSSPTLTGVAPLYSLNSLALLTCAAPPALPKPSLEFHVNNDKVHSSLLQEPIVHHDNRTRLYSVSQTLRLRTSLPIARRGYVLVRCTASVRDLYWKNTEVKLNVDVPEQLRQKPEFHLFGEASEVSSSTWLIFFVTYGVLFSSLN